MARYTDQSVQASLKCYIIFFKCALNMIMRVLNWKNHKIPRCLHKTSFRLLKTSLYSKFSFYNLSVFFKTESRNFRRLIMFCITHKWKTRFTHVTWWRKKTEDKDKTLKGTKVKKILNPTTFFSCLFRKNIIWNLISPSVSYILHAEILVLVQQQWV